MPSFRNAPETLRRFFIDPDTLRRFLKYGVVGATSTAIDLAVLAALTRAGWQLELAVAVSALCGMTNSYVWNRLWTFRDRPKKAVGRQYVQFLVVGWSGYVIGLLITAGLNYFWKPGQDLTAVLGIRVLTIACVATWDFVLNSLWTFGAASKAGPEIDGTAARPDSVERGD